jgi:hypothetical protein
MDDETKKYIWMKKISPHQMIPYIYSASLSYKKNKSIVDNCIAVAEHAELVLKNCPSRTMKDGNGRVKDGKKREFLCSSQQLWELGIQLSSADEEGDH